MAIKRNKDGRQCITDLRRELDARSDVNVHKLGGNWIVGKLIDNCWHENPCPYYFDERQALQFALFGEAESEAESAYHAEK
jgi:hypothetical protein